MNTIKLLIRSSILLLIIIVISCDKMLDVDMPANQIEKEIIFSNVQTANAALAGLYAGLRESSPLSANGTGSLLGTYSDDLDCFYQSDTNGTYAMFNNQVLDTNTSVYSLWSSSYQNIYRANAIIEGIEKSSLDQDDKNRIKGEALFVRSLLYLYLQQIFGDIPLILGTDYNINSSISKTAANEVIARILADIMQCTNLLPDTYRSAERIYPNKKVAQLVLAKLYLSVHQYQQAESVLKEILQSPLYQFQNDISKVFNKNSLHILWQLKPANATDPTMEAMTYYFSDGAPSRYAASQSLTNVFSENDLRKQNWLTLVSLAGKSWYRIDKYKNRSNNSTEYSVVFRIEEVYLLLAETLTYQNKIAESLTYINPTRLRAGLSPITQLLAKEQLLKEILLENRKEFFAEMGHRFSDLKRTDRLSELASTKPNWEDFQTLLPIPQQELLLNPNLNPQNFGY